MTAPTAPRTAPPAQSAQCLRDPVHDCADCAAAYKAQSHSRHSRGAARRGASPTPAENKPGAVERAPKNPTHWRSEMNPYTTQQPPYAQQPTPTAVLKRPPRNGMRATPRPPEWRRPG